MSDRIDVSQTVHRVTINQRGSRIVVAGPAAWRVNVRSPGPQGAPGNVAGLEHIQSTPSAGWNIPHTLGRRPNVAVYLDSGEHVEADVTASSSAVSITFPAPVMGSAVLT